MLHPPPKPALFPYTTLFRSSLHLLPLALPFLTTNIRPAERRGNCNSNLRCCALGRARYHLPARARRQEWWQVAIARSEEHTSELQSLTTIVCRLLLEKKNYA